jgi:anti-sigma regulatory factor (Ser/Thr protein kinase)
MPELKKSFSSELDSLGKIAPELEMFLEGNGFDVERIYVINLAFEEFATNIIKYAYADKGIGEISFSVKVEGESAVMTLVDEGEEFNPLTDAKEPDTELEPEDRDIGGLGIHLIRNMAKDIRYERNDNKNILIVEF